VNLKVVVLGAASLLISQGLTESLAGRFELLRLPHWSFAEMRASFAPAFLGTDNGPEFISQAIPPSYSMKQ